MDEITEHLAKRRVSKVEAVIITSQVAAHEAIGRPVRRVPHRETVVAPAAGSPAAADPPIAHVRPRRLVLHDEAVVAAPRGRALHPREVDAPPGEVPDGGGGGAEEEVAVGVAQVERHGLDGQLPLDPVRRQQRRVVHRDGRLHRRPRQAAPRPRHRRLLWQGRT